MDFTWYTSIAGIIAVTLIAVEVLKRAFGNISFFQAVPTWVYSVAVATGLTYGSKALGFLDEEGSMVNLLMQAVMLAASASGFWTWLRQPTSPIGDSAPAVKARSLS